MITVIVFQNLETEEKEQEDVIVQLKQLTTDICIQVCNIFSDREKFKNVSFRLEWTRAEGHILLWRWMI